MTKPELEKALGKEKLYSHILDGRLKADKERLELLTRKVVELENMIFDSHVAIIKMSKLSQ